MKTPALVKDYSRLSDANLDFKAQGIIVSLTGNAYFPATSPTLAQFTTIKEAYSQSMEKTLMGDRTSIALKNQNRQELLTAMKNLALSLEATAMGDRAKLISTGFDLASDGENVPVLTAPTNFTLTDGLNPGELKLSVKGVAKAVSYVHEYTEEPLTPESKWVSKATTSREHTFAGIRSGIRVYCRTAAIGRKGQEAYSTVLSRIVQ